MFSIRVDIGFLRFSRAQTRNLYRPTTSFARKYATEIRHAGLIRQGLVKGARCFVIALPR